MLSFVFFHYLCTMISLARHIQLLLLEHDCVIVPNLGGFIANHAEARYNDSGDALFLPPFRSIGFNPQLQVNDGLLVQSYMTAYDASYPAACLQMEQDVEMIINILDRNGVVELEGVGTITKSLGNKITFSSYEAGILTPSLYGLYSFEMESLEHVINAKKAEELLTNDSELLIKPQDENNKKEHRKTITITLNRKLIDIAVSAAAAIILFFGVSYPTLHRNASDSDTCVASACAVTPNNEVKSHIPQSKESASTTQIKKDVNKEVKKDENNVVEDSTREKEESIEEPKFAIVLASYVSQANATEYIELMKKQGFTESRYVKKGKVSRILYSGFQTEDEAYKTLTELRKQSGEFAQAWVLAL